MFGSRAISRPSQPSSLRPEKDSELPSQRRGGRAEQGFLWEIRRGLRYSRKQHSARRNERPVLEANLRSGFGHLGRLRVWNVSSPEVHDAVLLDTDLHLVGALLARTLLLSSLVPIASPGAQSQSHEMYAAQQHTACVQRAYDELTNMGL